MVFGIAGKRIDDVNFVAVWKRCQHEAEKQGDTCLHIGEMGAAHFRLQDKAIARAVEKGLDGLAVSIINSDWLYERSIKTAIVKKIPLITFDSDLDKKYAPMRSAYIGVDNLEVGRELGKIARQLRPGGGNVWLMSGWPFSTNLNERLLGVRRALSGDETFPQGKKLEGEGGWQEHSRSPWYCKDNYEISLEQMKFSLVDSGFDVFISVGHWPVNSSELYRKTVMSIKKRDLDTKRKLIIIGVGEILPEQAALLRDRLVHAYVSLDFKEMGKECYLHLKRLSTGGTVPRKTYTKTKTYLWKDQGIE
jgi:ribose transport system substrate-binding protein